MTKQRVYIGSNGDDAGRPGSISLYAFDPAGGKLTLVSTHPNVINPSFIALTPDRHFLYCVNESKTFAGQSGGGVSAFAVDPTNGSLAFLNSQPTHGVDPCYISLDHTGKYALVTNYSSGSVTIFPIRADGQLDASSDLIQHSGHSVNPDRQEAAHAHSVDHRSNRAIHSGG